jgi:hypothetical protein
LVRGRWFRRILGNLRLWGVVCSEEAVQGGTAEAGAAGEGDGHRVTSLALFFTNEVLCMEYFGNISIILFSGLLLLVVDFSFPVMPRSLRIFVSTALIPRSTSFNPHFQKTKTLNST